MSKKLILFDLDDTLLTDQKTVCEENYKAMEEAKAAGHILCAATGRSIEGTRRLFRRLEVEVPYILAFQGSLLYESSTDSVLASDVIPEEDVIDVLTAAYADGLYGQTYDEKQILIPRATMDFERYNAISHEDYMVFSDMTDLQGKNMAKVILIDYEHPERLHRFKEKYASKELGHFNSFFSQPMFLEYCKEGVDKGSGLRLLSETLQIPIEDTIAIGDERNDIAMIKAAGVGVCVNNGREEAKAVADYITEIDNNNGAVAEAIRKFALNSSN